MAAFNYQGKTALITGASSGIGKAYAYELAKRGANIAIAARSEDLLHEIAGDISDKHGVNVHVLGVDLSTEEGVQNVCGAMTALDLNVDILINNAGFGTHGRFHELDAERERQEIMLNVMALAELCRAFLPAMIKQNSGAIINVASVAGFQPTPFMSTYGATKAFVLSLTEGLWAECQDNNVKILALCPGPVDTGFFAATESKAVEKAAKAARPMSAEKVVLQSLKALDAGQSYVIPGASNKAAAFSSRLAPRSLVAKSVAAIFKPR